MVEIPVLNVGLVGDTTCGFIALAASFLARHSIKVLVGTTRAIMVVVWGTWGSVRFSYSLSGLEAGEEYAKD